MSLLYYLERCGITAIFIWLFFIREPYVNWNWIIAKSLEKEMATHSSIHGVVKSWTLLSDSTLLLNALKH